MFEIRTLAVDDLTAYKALRDATLAAYPEAFTSDVEAERAKTPQQYLPRLGLDRANAGHFTLGAFDAGALVGALSCERDPRIKVRHIGHVTAMMVRDGQHGRGIGSALLDACIAGARSAGIERLTINVTTTNLRALRLYERMGFRRYGTLVQAIKLGDRYHDKDHLVLEL